MMTSVKMLVENAEELEKFTDMYEDLLENNMKRMVLRRDYTRIETKNGFIVEIHMVASVGEWRGMRGHRCHYLINTVQDEEFHRYAIPMTSPYDEYKRERDERKKKERAENPCGGNAPIVTIL
ncbi:hypothetical protein CON15_19195 [Bacillus cereus]|uniref:Uncharacterized protein n=2 Tax=Bacillus thuringiensis TaxID=1428 RepID=A0A9X6U4G8_BACTU|nr:MULTISPECIES: hypothetical protein [Bacillus cereus group]MDO6628741.1 hypothetical protein [Bacillus thuringiensis]MDO6659337.1 hypothetical protein [Bacillus thuringiensis]PDZ55667.1 hypothetical protein CON15_19195 [Bacillus cereus]PED16334.1 hypothetical protein CON01_00360 [Bacillus thuringiensis]PFO26257.1 hypothetical protein COJ78_29580 [Bacillus thuringiensis]